MIENMNLDMNVLSKIICIFKAVTVSRSNTLIVKFGVHADIIYSEI